MAGSGPPLPVHAVLPELAQTLRDHRGAVLVAPTGAGKSTGVPTALLEAGLAGDGRIVMLEPRRVAARAVARRMAANLGEPVGETVGYQVRFEGRHSPRTRILVLTEGILTRRFIDDPFLEGTSLLVLDEFHERSVHSDLALAFARELMAVRDDLRLLVMSATLDAEPVSRYLHGCKVVRSEGRLFPLSVEHDERPDDRPLPQRVSSAVRAALCKAPEGGDVLVFLPGAGAIRRVEETLGDISLEGNPEVVPLFGALSHREQDHALTPGSRRRIILATNIAETSLTLPRVTAVVDSGLAKINRFDPAVGLDRLETVPISVPSADQRAGRAGRTAPGYVRRLWTAHDHRGRARSDIPEIRRVDAAPVLLRILAFHPGDPATYPLLDDLDEAQREGGLGLLRRIGALAPEGFELTAGGRRLAALPVHPRLGAILLRSAALGCPELGATIAALAWERDIYRFRDGEGRGTDPVAVDFDYRVALLDRFAREGASGKAARRLGISEPGARFALEARQQLLRALPTESLKRTDGEAVSVGRLLLCGFPDRVCRRRGPGDPTGVMVGGRGVRLARDFDGLAEDLLIALHADAGMRGDRATAKVFLASPVTRNDLEAEHPQLLSEGECLRYDEERQTVRGEVHTCFADLVIDTRPMANLDPEASGEALAAAAAERWATVFRPEPRAEQLIARIALAARELEGTEWPDVSEVGLRNMLPEICYGERTMKSVEAIDWFHRIAERLPYPARQRLDKACPERFVTPAGNAVPLDYRPAAEDRSRTPVLACRLQALFGLLETPRVLEGRVPLTVHLLAPNGRPCQQTQDLASFWRTTYPEVRKELKGRYPKHYWPEDPFTATPTARVRPPK